MKNILKHKKGELTDMFYFLITIFVMGIIFFVFIFVIPNISNGLRLAGLNNTAEGSSAIDSIDRIGDTTINYGFGFLFMGLVISVMITSFLVRTHPVFLFLYILFLTITLLLGIYLGNAYDQMIQNELLATALSDASLINLILGHILEITMAVGILSIIIVFAKFSSYGETNPI